MPNPTRETFESFVNGWFVRQRHFVEQLIHASSPDNTQRNALTSEEQKCLVNQVLSHFRQYYEEKSAAAYAGDNVFVFFSPPWLSSYEKIVLWIGGFKPSQAFKIIGGYVHDLAPHQQERLESLRLETRRQEKELMRIFALMQQSVADPPLMVKAKRAGQVRLVDGEVSEMEEAMKMLKAEMVVVLQSADELRCSTLGEMEEILSPPQTIALFKAAGELHLRLRELGWQRDRERA